jgi:hypothetical protein
MLGETAQARLGGGMGLEIEVAVHRALQTPSPGKRGKR